MNVIVIIITLIVMNKENIHLYYRDLCLCAYDNNKILCTSYSIFFYFFSTYYNIILSYYYNILWCDHVSD